MGAVHPWKPAVYLTVTVPVVQLSERAGPLVTTRTAKYPLINAGAEAGLLQIGGVARDSSGQPVAGAWLRIETPAAEPLQITETDQQGRFTLVGLVEGTYTLRLRAVDLGERTRDIDIPSPTGEYDLSFT
jgi:hypothetical protein